MSESRRRAAITSKTIAPDAWDAGLHGESEAGPIDVGLSIEPSALGVIVDAPGMGLLKVAFDVAADGTTRLARASRRLSDGRDAALVVVDEQQVLKLEGELQRARAEFDTQLGVLATERDEARDRAGILSEEKQSAAARREQLEARLATVAEQLQSEKDAQLELVNEREMLREELEAARIELARVEKALESASGLARGAEAQHQTELEWISSELKRKDEALTAATEKAGASDEQASRLSAELDALKAELAARTEELNEARAQVEALSQEKSKLEQELDRLTTDHQQLTRQHESLTRELQVSREIAAETEGRLQALSDTTESSQRETQDRLTEELAQLAAQLDDRQRDHDDARAQLQVATEELATRESQQAEAESKLSAVEAALAEASARHEEERGRYSSSESMVTAERNDARARIAALDEQVEEATRSGALAVATERAERERLEMQLEELREELAATKAGTNTDELSQLRAELAATRAAAASTSTDELLQLQNELSATQAAAAASADEVTMLRAELEAARTTTTAASTLDNEPADVELEQLRAQLAAEKSATAEARTLANKLLAERDEARTVARQLNQKASTLKAERDQWQQRFASMAANTPASSQDETREYHIESATDPNVPAVPPKKKDS